MTLGDVPLVLWRVGSLAGVQRGGADRLSLPNGAKGQLKGLSARGPKGQPRPPPSVSLLWGWAPWTGGPEALSASPLGVRWSLGEGTQLSPLTPGQGVMTTPPAAEGLQVTGQGLPGATGDIQQTSGWGPSEWPNGSCTQLFSFVGGRLLPHISQTQRSVSIQGLERAVGPEDPKG